MRKTLTKIFEITISIILIFQATKVYALTETEKLEQEKSQIDDQLDDVKKKQEEIEAQKSETMKSVEKLINQISSVEDETDELQSKIDDLQSQIDQKEKDITSKEEEYNKQMNLLDERMLKMYKTPKTGYLETFLTASSMTDFLAKYYAASELVSYDKKLMQDTKEQKEQIENEKSQLESNKEELKKSLSEKEAKSNELKSLKSDKDAQAAKLTEEEKKLQKEIEELEAANRKIANEIKEAEKKYQKQLAELQKNSGSNTPTGSGYFSAPVKAGITAKAYYSSGKFHGAVDYGVSVGTTVYAAADGVVMYTANLTNSYGTHVVIRHANGLQTYYAHGTRGSIVVSPGETVKKGQKIMLSGNTGNSTGPHLHFEVRRSPYNYKSRATAYGQDSRLNPLDYL